jgi:L-ornithine N5-monooxygenase
MADQPTPRPAEGPDGTPVYDLIGVGFGPANLALGIALEEEAERPGGTDLSRLFLEARPDPCWHPGMLLENSLVQITVLKDLVLPVNPRSRFTFLSYLQEKGRLFEFLNLRDLFPTRTEFNDYLCWVAGQLAGRVRYHHRARRVRALPRDGEVDLLEVVAADGATGEEARFLARNVVVAAGGRPWVPPGLGFSLDGASDRVFHSHEFMQRTGRGFPDRFAPHRFVVVGSGQSGAEIFHCLLERYPEADVTATVRGFGYKPADESDFVNEVFLPEMVDFFYDLPADRRGEVVDSFRDVNYSVVDHSLIRKIYRRLYDERVEGKRRARVLPYQELVAVEERDGAVRLRFRDRIRGHEREVEADGVVLCTGYRWDKEHPLLDDLSPWLVTDGDGGYRPLRDYRLESTGGLAPGVYLQGYCEESHGISETVLSLLPVRAQDILRSLLARAAERPEALVASAAGADG